MNWANARRKKNRLKNFEYTNRKYKQHYVYNTTSSTTPLLYTLNTDTLTFFFFRFF